MEEEARVANKKKKQEKDEKWEKKRKIEVPECASLLNKQHNALELRVATKTYILNMTFILAKNNTEVTVLTPVLVPAVGELPVLNTVLHAPADELRSVSAESLTRHVLVDARLVGQEVLVHIENRLQRTGFHQFSLNGINAVKNNEDLLEEVLVLRVLHRVPLLALSGAFGSGLELAALGVEIAQSVMLALGEGVGVAPVLGTIRATSAHALVHERVPGINGIAALATLAAILAAAYDIEGRQTILDLSLRSNAPTIRGSGSSSPARAADGLIADLLNGGH